MKILLFGKSGQLGWELQHSLASLGEVIALGTDSQELCGDFRDLAGIVQTVQSVAPDIIVNAAAYTAVDKAESEPELAHCINALAPGVLAREAKQRGAWLIHYSTDYVFDGTGSEPWLETDMAAPLNAYGKTKFEGEESIRASGCQHLIFRTSWVYAARGNNFVKTILRLAQERELLSVVNDQIGAPTSANLLADFSAQAIPIAMRSPMLSGLYHLAAGGEGSWCDYAKFIIKSARQMGFETKLLPEAVESIASSAYILPAVRPKNSRLNTLKLQTAFGFSLPSWQSGVTQVLSQILEGQL